MTDATPAAWHSTLNPHLLRRLMRPLLRPGRIRLQMAHTLLQRLSFGRQAPLQEQVTRTWNPGESTRPALPIVYAEAPTPQAPQLPPGALSPEPPVVQAQAATHTPPPLPIWAAATSAAAPAALASPTLVSHPAPKAPAAVIQRKPLAQPAIPPAAPPTPPPATPAEAGFRPTPVLPEAATPEAPASAMPLVRPLVPAADAEAVPTPSITRVSAQPALALPLVQPLSVERPKVPAALPTETPRPIVQPLATIKDQPPLVEISWVAEQPGTLPTVMTYLDFASQTPAAREVTALPIVRPAKFAPTAPQTTLPVVQAGAPTQPMPMAQPNLPLNSAGTTPTPETTASLPRAAAPPVAGELAPGPLVAPRFGSTAANTADTPPKPAPVTDARPATLGTVTTPAAKPAPNQQLDLNALTEKVQRKLKRDLARELELERERRGRYPR